jgi:hypothetical protein
MDRRQSSRIYDHQNDESGAFARLTASMYTLHPLVSFLETTLRTKQSAGYTVAGADTHKHASHKSRSRTEARKI